MIYIQLSLPYRNYNKVFIKTLFLYDNSLAVTYEVKNDSLTLFEKTFTIGSDIPEFNKIITSKPNVNLSVTENIHKLVLEYMIEKNIETGTLEIL